MKQKNLKISLWKLSPKHWITIAFLFLCYVSFAQEPPLQPENSLRRGFTRLDALRNNIVIGASQAFSTLPSAVSSEVFVNDVTFTANWIAGDRITVDNATKFYFHDGSQFTPFRVWVSDEGSTVGLFDTFDFDGAGVFVHDEGDQRVRVDVPKNNWMISTYNSSAASIAMASWHVPEATNAQEIINYVIDLAEAAGGATVVLTDGDFITVAPIVISDDNVSLVGLQKSASRIWCKFNSATNYEGAIVIGESGSFPSNTNISNLTIYRQKSVYNSSFNHGITDDGQGVGSNLKISNVVFFDCAGYGISIKGEGIGGIFRCFVDGNFFWNNNGGIELISDELFQITNNIFEDNTTAIKVLQNSEEVLVEGNSIDNSIITIEEGTDSIQFSNNKISSSEFYFDGINNDAKNNEFVFTTPVEFAGSENSINDNSFDDINQIHFSGDKHSIAGNTIVNNASLSLQGTEHNFSGNNVYSPGTFYVYADGGTQVSSNVFSGVPIYARPDNDTGLSFNSNSHYGQSSKVFVHTKAVNITGSLFSDSQIDIEEAFTHPSTEVVGEYVTIAEDISVIGNRFTNIDSTKTSPSAVIIGTATDIVVTGNVIEKGVGGTVNLIQFEPEIRSVNSDGTGQTTTSHVEIVDSESYKFGKSLGIVVSNNVLLDEDIKLIRRDGITFTSSEEENSELDLMVSGNVVRTVTSLISHLSGWNAQTVFSATDIPLESTEMFENAVNPYHDGSTLVFRHKVSSTIYDVTPISDGNTGWENTYNLFDKDTDTLSDITGAEASARAWSAITDPTADLVLGMGSHQTQFNFTNSAASWRFNVSGAFTGDVFRIDQDTGNPGAGTSLLRLEAEDPDVILASFLYDGDNSGEDMLRFQLDRATPTDGDYFFWDYYFDNSSGTATQFLHQDFVATDVTAGSEDAAFRWDVMSNGTLTEMFTVGGDGVDATTALRLNGQDVLTSVDISDDSNLTAGTGITLTDDTLSLGDANLTWNGATLDIDGGTVDIAATFGSSDTVGGIELYDNGTTTAPQLVADDNHFIANVGGDERFRIWGTSGTMDMKGSDPQVRFWNNDAASDANVSFFDFYLASTDATKVLSRISATSIDSTDASFTGRMDFVNRDNGSFATVLQLLGHDVHFPAMSTEELALIDAGSASATEQDWIEVTVGGVTGYIRVYATK